MVLCWRRYGRVGGCRFLYGGVAQLGEHLPCKQGVKSSNLSVSTKVLVFCKDFFNANNQKFLQKLCEEIVIFLLKATRYYVIIIKSRGWGTQINFGFFAYDLGDWSNGMIGVSKTFGGSSILSSPVPEALKTDCFQGFFLSKIFMIKKE